MNHEKHGEHEGVKTARSHRQEIIAVTGARRYLFACASRAPGYHLSAFPGLFFVFFVPFVVIRFFFCVNPRPSAANTFFLGHSYAIAQR
jgi:hypothetical protein